MISLLISLKSRYGVDSYGTGERRNVNVEITWAITEPSAVAPDAKVNLGPQGKPPNRDRAIDISPTFAIKIMAHPGRTKHRQ